MGSLEDRWRVACGGATKIGVDIGAGYEVVLAGGAWKVWDEVLG